MYQFAEEHSIIGLLFGGIEKLPKSQLPEMELLMDWVGQKVYIKTQKKEHDKVISDFAQLMEREHITYVVFKGLAAASHYPKPEFRATGDIDFYVSASDFDRAVEVIESEWGDFEEKDRKDKHFAFSRNGIRFEMHYSIETFGCLKHQHYFDALVEQYVSLGNAHFRVGVATEDPQTIPMLQPMLDLIVVAKHWFNHLLGEGAVSDRQRTWRC